MHAKVVGWVHSKVVGRLHLKVVVQIVVVVGLEQLVFVLHVLFVSSRHMDRNSLDYVFLSAHDAWYIRIEKGYKAKSPEGLGNEHVDHFAKL